ncbi:hypothetical protein SJAV_21040 [Sulfurisphaera javensis]|uniref:Uncharacterized protein n=1 Tax=Sulfurisphaera javensis TaxID=2049879 RepID=A0AAT9GTY1_9CREN
MPHIGGILGIIIGFIIGWIIASIPVWLASKIVSRHSSFGRAMLATLAGYIVFIIVVGIFTGISALLGRPIIGIFGIIIAFIALLGVFKILFETGWGGAFLIAILSIIIAFVIAFILGLIGISILSLHGVPI